MAQKLIVFHNSECDFYEIFKNVEDLPLPKVYYVQKCIVEKKQTGVIFMEDLSEKMDMLDFFQTMNVHQVFFSLFSCLKDFLLLF